MCGVVFAASAVPVSDFVQYAHRHQHHRGPDGQGFHFEKHGDVHIGMSHQRLSIVGLSRAGDQPMVSKSGRLRIVFNGEIYNYKELANQYGLKDLQTGTDTEVAIELIELLGIEEACKKFNGMWAMVVLDSESGRAYVARDRVGKKPLYYHVNEEGIHFASEMQALLYLHSVAIEPNITVAARFLTASLLNADEKCWLKSVNSLPPSSIAEIDLANPHRGLIRLRRYWSPSLDDDYQGSLADCIEEARELIKDAVKIRLHADVRVGVALSGGIDSSVIATQTAGSSSKTYDVFSAVNPGQPGDESAFVDMMARHLGIDVSRYQLDPQQERIFELLQTSLRFSDGPLPSFSGMLFHKLMEAARAGGVKVVLTGQGADEVFCGYRKYTLLEIKRRIKQKQIAHGARLLLLGMKNSDAFRGFKFNEAKRYIGFKPRFMGESLSDLDVNVRLGEIDSMSSRQWIDISSYSVPFLCHYEDRMSMACSLEVRSPFLDYRLIELGLRMPSSYKLAKGWAKYPLRMAFRHELPHSIAWRKDKKGFTNPQDEWLKTSLRPHFMETMSSRECHVYKFGLVDQKKYLKVFDSYCSGRPDIYFRDVFAPFSLELWLREFTEKKKRARND